jgi:hypothetical protein
MTKQKHKNIECSFYKFIGVLWFKEIVLYCEELLHINNGYRLTNYHPEKMTTEGINNFYWQLAYNCTLHITSIVLSLLYFVFASIGNIRIVPLNIIVLIMIIFNLYCIFLQRYTYLRMQQTLIGIENILEQQYKLKISKINAMSSVYISEEKHKAVLKLIDRVEGVFLKERSCFINEEDICALELIEKTLCGIDVKIRTISFGETMNKFSIDGGIRYLNPCKRVNVIVGILKYIFNKKRYLFDK